jgi:hypothetical protein
VTDAPKSLLTAKSDGACLVQGVYGNIALMTADKRIIRRPIAGLVIVIGVLLLSGSLIVGYLRRSISNPELTKLPKSIAGFSLNTATYGPEAVAEITRLHGKAFPIDYGAMGMYGDANQISLWVAGFSSHSMAAQIISAMEEKIALGNSPFSPTGQQQAGKRAIYLLDGMGQKHFYFQSGNLVLWLAADPTVADQTIKQILEEYP